MDSSYGAAQKLINVNFISSTIKLCSICTECTIDIVNTHRMLIEVWGAHVAWFMCIRF